MVCNNGARVTSTYYLLQGWWWWGFPFVCLCICLTVCQQDISKRHRQILMNSFKWCNVWQAVRFWWWFRSWCDRGIFRNWPLWNSEKSTNLLITQEAVDRIQVKKVFERWDVSLATRDVVSISTSWVSRQSRESLRPRPGSRLEQFGKCLGLGIEGCSLGISLGQLGLVHSTSLQKTP